MYWDLMLSWIVGWRMLYRVGIANWRQRVGMLHSPPSRPSSLARGLVAGAQKVERIDRLIQVLAAQHGLKNHKLDEIVWQIDRRIELNVGAGTAA